MRILQILESGEAVEYFKIWKLHEKNSKIVLQQQKVRDNAEINVIKDIWSQTQPMLQNL